MKKTLIILFASLISALPLCAKARVTVAGKAPKNCTSTFAVFTDRATYKNCEKALKEYKNVLDSEGLGTYIYVADWTMPEEVRSLILDQYVGNVPMEGAVFIGNVPVVRAQGGQHMTTAFKMNEKAFPITEASVTTDRYYDDFGLQFDFIRRDSANSNIFYYRINERGDQFVSCDIYSGRILVPEDMPGDHFALMNDYLHRVVEAHRENNPLDHIIFYAGSGYNSDDLNLWREKPMLFKEYFPLAFKNASGNHFYDFRQNDGLVRKLFTEIQRPETDAFFFSEHGAEDTQYITNPEKDEDLASNIAWYYHGDSIQKAARTKIVLKDIDSLHSGARFIMLNACFNGSFHAPGYVAGHHIFNGGRCIAVQGNTVNVLQDKWEDQLEGMLSLGFRIGFWQEEFPYLESHIIGDPTFGFTPVEFKQEVSDFEKIMVLTPKSEKYATIPSYWSWVANNYYDPRITSLAVKQVAKSGNREGMAIREISDWLLHVFERDLSISVRLQALNELYSIGDHNMLTALKEGFNDPSEEIRRLCARYAGSVGDTSLIRPLVNTMLYDAQSKRVAYEAATSIQVFPRNAVEASIAEAEKTRRMIPLEGNKPDDFSGLTDSMDYLDTCAVKVVDKSASVGKRISAIRMMRNYNVHDKAAVFSAVACDASEPLELRVAVAEAMGWYSHSVNRGVISDAFRNAVDQQADMPAELKSEMLKTIKRLK